MLSKLDLYLADVNTDSIQSSLAVKLHGYLFHMLDARQANMLHQMRLNPFSLFVIPTQEGYVLRVSALTDYAEIVLDCFEKCKEIPIYGVVEPLIIKNAIRYPATELTELTDTLDGQIKSRKLKLSFVTPTAWKADGFYRNLPEMGKIFKPVINKMNIFGGMMLDEEACCGVFKKLTIADFDFHSCYYRITKDTIPGFTGSVTVLTDRNNDDFRLLTKIITYSLYSGAGIKTSLGMGGMTVSTKADDMTTVK